MSSFASRIEYARQMGRAAGQKKDVRSPGGGAAGDFPFSIRCFLLFRSQLLDEFGRDPIDIALASFT